MVFIFNKNVLSLNIKHLRKAKKLTQGALCDIIGAKSTTLSNWETGFSSPELEFIVKIYNYFGISLDNLILIPFDKWILPQESGLPQDSNCTRCIDKERTINSQADTISLLKEKVEGLKHKLASQNIGSGDEKVDKRQTA